MLRAAAAPGPASARLKETKVFCFFSSEKKSFLLLLCRTIEARLQLGLCRQQRIGDDSGWLARAPKGADRVAFCMCVRGKASSANKCGGTPTKMPLQTKA